MNNNGLLSIKHFKDNTSIGNSDRNFDKLIKQGIVVPCLECHKMIWSRWYAGKPIRGSNYKKKVNKCALCFTEEDWNLS